MDWMMYCKAFFVGGAICLAGQILIDRTKMTQGRILTMFVCLGALLSAFGVYDVILEFAGAGASVPISGFGHLMAKGVAEGFKENGLMGFLGGAVSAGSIGVAAAILFGYLNSIIFKPKTKNRNK